MNDLDRFTYEELAQLSTRIYHGANKLWTYAEKAFVTASQQPHPGKRAALYAAYKIIQAAAKEQTELHRDICVEMRSRRVARHG